MAKRNRQGNFPSVSHAMLAYSEGDVKGGDAIADELGLSEEERETLRNPSWAKKERQK